MDLPGIELRPLRREDFPLLSRWLAEPLVARWWNDDSPPDAVEAAIAGAPDVIAKVQSGKVAALGALVGAVMKTTRGKADAATVKRMLEERLVG